MADSEATQTKRCPRCETTKHKSEITSRGWCRPCSRAYDREREVARAAKEGRAPSKPRTIREIADKVAAPETSVPRAIVAQVEVPVGHSTESRITRELAVALLEVLEDGERVTLTVERLGPALIIERWIAQ